MSFLRPGGAARVVSETSENHRDEPGGEGPLTETRVTHIDRCKIATVQSKNCGILSQQNWRR